MNHLLSECVIHIIGQHKAYWLWFENWFLSAELNQPTNLPRAPGQPKPHSCSGKYFQVLSNKFELAFLLHIIMFLYWNWPTCVFTGNIQFSSAILPQSFVSCFWWTVFVVILEGKNGIQLLWRVNDINQKCCPSKQTSRQDDQTCLRVCHQKGGVTDSCFSMMSLCFF